MGEDTVNGSLARWVALRKRTGGLGESGRAVVTQRYTEETQRYTESGAVFLLHSL